MKAKQTQTNWDAVANWYNGWGKAGSYYHRRVAIPTTLELLQLRHNERLLDIGAGTGVLVPYIARANCDYLGIDASSKMIQLARRYHAQQGRFLNLDVNKLSKQPDIQPASFDAAVFLFSIQDMHPLDQVLKASSCVLKPEGRLIIFMIHPCFRVPRQSGWDKQRKLNYHRIDRYLSPLSIPMKTHEKGCAVSTDHSSTISAPSIRLGYCWKPCANSPTSHLLLKSLS